MAQFETPHKTYFWENYYIGWGRYDNDRKWSYTLISLQNTFKYKKLNISSYFSL